MTLPMLPAPGSKLHELAATIERYALEAAPPLLAADPLFREKLRVHCLRQAVDHVAKGGRYRDTVQ